MNELTELTEIYKTNKKKVTFSNINKVYKTYSNKQYNRKGYEFEYKVTYKDRIMDIIHNYII